MKEKYLPIVISEIAGKGLGAIASQDIDGNSIICSYIGVFGTN